MIRALQEAEDDEILDVILDIIKRDADVWTAMDLWPRLGDKLLDRHHVLERKGKEHLRLMQLLRVLAQKKRLTPDDEDEVEQLQTSIDKVSSHIKKLLKKARAKERVCSQRHLQEVSSWWIFLKSCPIF